MTEEELQARIATVPHWYHRIELAPGVVTPGINDATTTLARLDLPEDCTGLRVLDLGARDGFFSFELERRGAEVLALDYIAATDTGFAVAREVLGSSVTFEVCNVYDVDPARHGSFDIVLFLGLLYHLRNPLTALDRIRAVCRPGARVLVETQLLDEAVLRPDGTFAPLDEHLRDVPLMQFFPRDTLNGDPTNYWAPNAACMRGLLDDAGFTCTAEDVAGARGIFHAAPVTDAWADYHRQLEHTTPDRASGRTQ